MLNVPKSTLQYRLRKHGLNPKDYTAEDRVREPLSAKGHSTLGIHFYFRGIWKNILGSF